MSGIIAPHFCTPAGSSSPPHLPLWHFHVFVIKPVKLVAIVGGSGSGKSWLAQQLEKKLAPDAACLSLDDFYLDRSHLTPTQRLRLNFDHPRAIDWKGLSSALRALRDGRRARLPVYDFTSHCRRRQLRLLKPKPVLLVEGLWLLHRRELRRLFDFSIFLNVSRQRRIERRLRRDVSERGRDRASVLEQFNRMVEPMHRKYVAPQAKWADLVLSRTCTSRQTAQIAKTIRTQRGGSIRAHKLCARAALNRTLR
jgi:uridine kinase